MLFVDFLRTAVLLFGGAATALAAVAVAGANSRGEATVLLVAFGWWVVAAGIGLYLGRGATVSPAIGRTLAQARATPTHPELEPGRLLFNRLWSLAAVTLVAGALAFILPQVPAIAVGFTLIVALAWRRQGPAVAAIEERDGVRFWIDRTSAFAPTRLLRTPGLRRVEPQLADPVERAGA